MSLRHVVVGAGPAGLNAVETLRALDAEAEITLIGDELPYSRMVLPYYLAGEIEERAVLTGNDAWFEELRVQTIFGSRVASLSTETDRLVLEGGEEVAYDRLLLATGSRAGRPPIDGAEGPGVVNLWTLDDARAFLGGPHREAVIVGAGFIAFTILDAVVRRAGHVRFLEIAPQILPHMLDRPAAKLMEAHLADRDIAVHKETSAERIESVNGRRRLRLADGASIECDVVVMATGIQPNLEFLDGSGIEIDHGILVDAKMRTSRPNVYAAGDVAQGLDLLSDQRRVQAIQPTAVDHGRVAAANMAGLDVSYSGSLTMNILAAQGLEACSFGLWEGEEREITCVENASNRIYRKYVWEDDRLVGGLLVGPSMALSGVNDVGMLKGLIQTGIRLGRWREYLEENPLDLRRPYVASGAARELLDSTLLAGRTSAGGGFRFPALPALRRRSRHHGALLTGIGS